MRCNEIGGRWRVMTALDRGLRNKGMSSKERRQKDARMYTGQEHAVQGRQSIQNRGCSRQEIQEMQRVPGGAAHMDTAIQSCLRLAGWA